MDEVEPLIETYKGDVVFSGFPSGQSSRDGWSITLEADNEHIALQRWTTVQPQAVIEGAILAYDGSIDPVTSDQHIGSMGETTVYRTESICSECGEHIAGDTTAYTYCPFCAETL